MTRQTFTALLSALLLYALPSFAQSYKDDIGWTELNEQLGGATPDGAGVNASLVEADEISPNLHYQVDASLPEFSGKSFTNLTAGGSTSGHATFLVGQNYFGNTQSIAPGITSITAYEANDWISSVLNFGQLGSQFLAPDTVTADVQNFSWVGSTGGEANDTQILKRFDASIATSDYVAVVGLNNGVGAIPALLGQSYNAIVVGRSDGLHSSGLTTINGIGRPKPDIVAPKGTTSEATAAVSSSAAVLIQAAGGAASAGAHAVVIKSVLLAGATRNDESEFTWTADRDNGVNSAVGAGELNILRNVAIMSAGEKTSGISLGEAGRIGWDYGAVSSSNTQTYYFQIPDGGLYDYGIVLSWMLDLQSGGVMGGGWNTPTSTLADLDLAFYHASGTTLGTLIATGYDDARDLSTSGDVNNLEMLAFGFLAQGGYAVQVTSASGSSTNYGVAWVGTAVPEPSSFVLLGASILVLCVIRVRRRLV